MGLRLVRPDAGTAELGAWGALRLTGAESATFETSQAVDVTLPPSVARELPAAVFVLNDLKGILLILPYTGETFARIELGLADDSCSLTDIPRIEDEGLRLSHLRMLDQSGVLFMTEYSLLCFDEDLRVAWRCDEDFGAWVFETVEDGQVRLMAEFAWGREERQIRALRDGRRIG